MLTSEGLTELKYQEILEYQEVVTNAALHSAITHSTSAEIVCLFTAIFISIVMSCCALVFMPNSQHRHRRQPNHCKQRLG